MEIMLILAFVSFFALVVAWMAAPTGTKRPAETGTFGVGEARA
jgi:hypothetical protein